VLALIENSPGPVFLHWSMARIGPAHRRLLPNQHDGWTPSRRGGSKRHGMSKWVQGMRRSSSHRTELAAAK